MSEILKGAEFRSKDQFSLPAGADITKKSYRISIEEIENGYILTKSYDIEYQNMEGDKDYNYYSKKYFSKDNPMRLKINDSEVNIEDKLD